MKKTFRYKLNAGSSDHIDPAQRIRLKTNNGLVGYQIKKLQVIAGDPTDTTTESVIQIFSVEPETLDTDVIDFGNPTLMAVAHYSNHLSGSLYPEDSTIIFDSTIINQDMFIICKNDNTDKIMNIYLELEQTKLSKDEATVATLKDMRAGPDTNFGP